MTFHDVLSRPEPAAAAVLVLALLAALAAYVALRVVVRRGRAERDVLAVVLRRCVKPAGAALLLLALEFVRVGAGTAAQSGAAALPLDHALSVALLVTLTWLAIRALLGVEEAVNLRYSAAGGGDSGARRVRTQTRVLSRFGVLLIGSVGAGSVLMTFPSVRHFGVSLLASAGVAGIVVGFAARPVLSNLLAGLQIALTRPILLDDVLVVQGKQGRVEEITGTYVVLSVWDGSRMVIPLQWFIENPFVNLTRGGAQLTGSVLLWVDYATPLAPLRAELERVVRSAPEWDGRAAALQVGAADARAMQLLVTVSSRDSDSSDTLCARVREALIDFLQRAQPECLPRLRVEQAAGVHNGAP